MAWFQRGCSPRRWSTAFWAALEAEGWFWSKGKGLVDFYYVRPGVKPHTQGVAFGVHFFGSEEEVLRFVQREIAKVNGPDEKEEEEEEAMEVEEAKQGGSSGLLSRNGRGVVRSDDEDDELLFTGDERVSRSPVTATAPVVVIAPPVAPVLTAAQVLEAIDVKNMLWKDLWRALRANGWSWDFGTGNVRSVYFVPHFDKRNRDAQLGVHRFESEEQVRLFVRRNKFHLKPKGESVVEAPSAPPARVGGAPSMPVIPEEQEGEGDSQAVDSQAQTDPAEWTLVANRSKRKLADRRLSDGDDDVDDKEEVAPPARRNGSLLAPSNKVVGQSLSSSSSAATPIAATHREPVRSKKTRIELQQREEEKDENNEEEEGSQELGTQVQVRCALVIVFAMSVCVNL